MNDAHQRAGWHKARPQHLPKPSYFPFFLAFSLMFFLWGLVSLWLIAVMGLAGVFVSLAGWVKDLVAAAKEEQSREAPDAESGRMIP